MGGVTSIAVIGLYIAYVIPTFLRWRMGDAFEPGPWTLGRKYRWINPIAIVWVIICVIVFSLPQGAAGAPWMDEFDWKYVNYAPFTVLAVIAAVGLWWLLSAETGDVRVGMGKFAWEGPALIVRYFTWSDNSLTDCSNSRIKDYRRGMLAQFWTQRFALTSCPRRASLCQVMTSFLRLRISEWISLESS